MTKYRIRLIDGRVIGPFEKQQLFDLKVKGHISGNEDAQVFPVGNWESIRALPFYSEMMDENKTHSPPIQANDNTFVIDLTKLRNVKNEREIKNLEEEKSLPIESLTETLRLETSEPVLGKEKTSVTKSLNNLDLSLDENVNSHRDSKTIINPVAQEEIRKMQKLQRQAKAEEDKISKELALREANEIERIKELEIALQDELVSPSDSTQVITLDMSGLLEMAIETELTIDEAKKKAEKIKKDEEQILLDTVEKNLDKAKKKKLIIVIAALAIALAVFFPDEKPKEVVFKHLEPNIIFPIPFDLSDAKKSSALFNQGIQHFNRGTYSSIRKAGISFKESYENNLENSAALNFLVRAYAEQLQNSSQKLIDAQSIFNIIQSKRSLLVQDVNGVIGMNIFYAAINKPDAGIDVIQKYLKIRPKEITQDLFAIYLQSLLERGRLDLAKQFYPPLIKAPEKNRYTYNALIKYYVLNQELEKALNYADEAIKKHPQIVSFYLLKAEILINQQNVDNVLPLLKKAQEMGLDGNNLNRAKLFELQGLYFVLKNKPKEASKYLTRSLKLSNSDDLRIRLANLESGDGAGNETDKLINESKAVKLLYQAKDFFEKRNYELALSTAAKATDIYPHHVPSELFLAKTQLKLGLTKQGLKTLDDLAARYPEDTNVNTALIEAFIETYKFNEARTRIQNITDITYRESYQYSSMNAKFHLKMGDSLQAMSWLKNSISINPLNDVDVFTLAEILLRRSNFDGARSLLNKCMDLDPVNPDYRIAYARLIYETQDDLAATGYLLSLLDDFGDNPKVLSEIAIFYFRSGKVKEFLDYKAKLEKSFSTDRSLYDFLIKAALLDERLSEIPGLVENLLKVEPGDLGAMMTAGKILFEEGKLDLAAKWFTRVKEKLPSYPKVLYYLAKIDFSTGNIEGARKKIQENIKANGENDEDFVLLAQMHASKEEFIEAENMYKKAQKINSRSYDAILGLADLSSKRNNQDMARDLYKQALKLKSDEPLLYKKMGDVYRQLGQGNLAIESYKLYLEMEPESPHKGNLEAYINLMK